MAIREIPKSFETTCDKCGRGVSHPETYTESTPPNWIKLGLYDGVTKKRFWWLLCPACHPNIQGELTLNGLTREKASTW